MDLPLTWHAQCRSTKPNTALLVLQRRDDPEKAWQTASLLPVRFLLFPKSMASHAHLTMQAFFSSAWPRGTSSKAWTSCLAVTSSSRLSFELRHLHADPRSWSQESLTQSEIQMSSTYLLKSAGGRAVIFPGCWTSAGAGSPVHLCWMVEVFLPQQRLSRRSSRQPAIGEAYGERRVGSAQGAGFFSACQSRHEPRLEKVTKHVWYLGQITPFKADRGGVVPCQDQGPSRAAAPLKCDPRQRGENII